MFKNYLRVALRNLFRKKGYSFINVAGLTLGLASCLIIFQYVAYEYSFDRFHEHEDDLYRVATATARMGEEAEADALTPYALAPALADAVPEVLQVARLHPQYGPAVVSNPAHADRVFEEERVYYADPAFLKMFTFPLAAGNAETALAPGTVLLSEATARKYFGTADPVGQTLDVTGWIAGPYEVSGVFQDVPANSHLQFDLLLPMDDLLADGSYSNPESAWSWTNFITYVQLRPGADPAAAERTMTEVLLSHRGEDYRQNMMTARIEAQPLRDVHLNSEIHAPEAVTGSYRTVYFFTIVGLVTLLIALVNYVNLATARSLDRAREVGVRKAVGAHRRQLIFQFLCDSALTNLVAAALAVALAVALTPLINDLAETQLTRALWLSPAFWASFIGTLAVATLLAGIYPAFVLSSFKPVLVLKGKSGHFRGQLWLRRGLVMLQFSASVVLIGGTAVVYDQLRYMQEMDVGLDLEQVLTVEGPRVLPEGTKRTTATSTFLEELRRLPGVRQVATSSTLPGQGFQWYASGIKRATADPADAIYGVYTAIDTNFAALYGLELVAGRGFGEGMAPAAKRAPRPVIANETAVHALGFTSPEEAVDQAVDLAGTEARIIGVFRDFNWSSAHEARENIFFGRTAAGQHISLRVETGDLSGTIASIESMYDRLFPGNVFEHAFVDKIFDQQYRNERRFAALFSLFAGLAVAIACLGLFGLASFTAQQRTKEIGVRKVLGATVPQLAGLLSKDFVKLVGAAFVVGAPVAYFAMQRWLEGFAYRVEIGPGAFVLTGALVVVIALVTVSYQSVRAALADPAKSLRYE